MAYLGKITPYNAKQMKNSDSAQKLTPKNVVSIKKISVYIGSWKSVALGRPNSKSSVNYSGDGHWYVLRHLSPNLFNSGAYPENLLQYIFKAICFPPSFRGGGVPFRGVLAAITCLKPKMIQLSNFWSISSVLTFTKMYCNCNRWFKRLKSLKLWAPQEIHSICNFYFDTKIHW